MEGPKNSAGVKIFLNFGTQGGTKIFSLIFLSHRITYDDAAGKLPDLKVFK